MAKFTYLDRESYQEIPIFYMSENNNGGLPFHIQKYTLRHATLLHRHDFMQINYIVNGSGEHIINGNAFPINTGDIFVIPPYVPHKISSSEPDSLKIFEFEFNTDFIVGCSDTEIDSSAYFDFAYLEPFLVSEHQVKPRLNLTGGLQVEVEAVLNEALEEYRQRRKGFALVIKSRFCACLFWSGGNSARPWKKTSICKANTAITTALYSRQSSTLNTITIKTSHWTTSRNGTIIPLPTSDTCSAVTPQNPSGSICTTCE